MNKYKEMQNIVKSLDMKRLALIFSGIIFLLSLILVFSHFWTGLVLFIVGFFISPPLLSMLEKRTGVCLTKKARYILIIGGIIVAFVLMGSTSEKYEIPIYESEQNPEDVIASTKVTLEAVSHLQDAQLNTVALLAVRFETADKDAYITYIDEVLEKWKKVEESAQAMEEIEGTLPDTVHKPLFQSKLINEAYAQTDLFSDTELPPVEFGDGFEGKNGEVEISPTENMVYKNAIDDAFAFKRTGLTKTANQFLRYQLKTTAEGAQQALVDHKETMNLTVDDVDAAYGSAARTAEKIAYTSKVSLYVLGTVASFGSAAAATSGAGVITGYITGAWGAAIGAADIALDIAEEASKVSTGKGLVAYHKDKDIIGKISEIHAYANITQIVVSGGGKISFREDGLTNANNAIGLFNLSSTARNMTLDLDGDTFDVRIVDTIKALHKEDLNSIIKKIYKEGFDYNAISVTIDDEGNLDFDSNASKETIADGVASDCQQGDGADLDDKYLKIYWPECPEKKDPCQGLANSCIHKGRCICKTGFYGITPGDGVPILDCVDEEAWFQRLAIQLKTSIHNGGNRDLTAEEQAFIDEIERTRPALIKRANKAMQCAL